MPPAPSCEAEFAADGSGDPCVNERCPSPGGPVTLSGVGSVSPGREVRIASAPGRQAAADRGEIVPAGPPNHSTHQPGGPSKPVHPEKNAPASQSLDLRPATVSGTVRTLSAPKI